MHVKWSEAHLFRHFTDAQRGALDGAVATIERKKGESVLLRGEHIPGIYVVARGQLALFAPGIEQPFAHFNLGDVVGETCFIQKNPASVTIRAAADASLLFIRRQKLDEMMAADPAVAAAITRGVAEILYSRLNATNKKLGSVLGEHAAKLRQMASPAEILAKVSAEIEGNRAGHRVDASLSVGIRDCLLDLAQRLPDERALLGSIAEDVMALRQRETVVLQSFERLFNETRELLEALAG